MPEGALRADRGSDDVVVVTVDRQDRRNAMDRAAWFELRDLVRALRDDEALRGVIVTGAGDKAFVAGADVEELADRDPWVALAGAVQRTLLELDDLPVPTVAALNGDALGGGWELALACDLRVAAGHARVGFPEVGLGIMPGAGGTQRLLHHVGLGRAKELVFTGRLLDAGEAAALGLVNAVADDALGEARRLMGTILRQAPTSVRLAKTVLNATARQDSGADLERLAYTLTFHTEERGARMRRFLERRRQ
jgi:enoyl-CoA hydratase